MIFVAYMSTNKAAVTKVKAKQHMSILSHKAQLFCKQVMWPFGYGMVHMAAHSVWPSD